MAKYPLEPRDGALRVVVPQSDWQRIAAIIPDLPDFLGELPPGELAPEADTAIIDDLDQALQAALSITQDHHVQVDVQAAVGPHGVALRLWISQFAAVEVRRSVTIIDGQPHIKPGVEISAVELEHVIDEILRYLIDRPLTDEAIAFSLPEETLLPLTHALTDGRVDDVRLLLDNDGLAEVPPLLRALVAAVEGDALIETHSAAGHRILRLLLTRAGWVETHTTSDAHIVSTPYDRAAMGHLLTVDLSEHLSRAHTPGHTGGEES
ncbi:hypothetical protein KEM60_03207 [Austwickia sp. TVS 96-490-7B]|uniref:hypothetical protein n=1 Tax=Austwickia sp. TVS 96-490-7B TaxID=2830843 RepID=UPI001C58557C|nr:hypothetical protein [Austwickia sp. TVS 96-490-7B]MBW3086977.1 hypothetical protein [Austwickia sp. TVS 96-490-7B]